MMVFCADCVGASGSCCDFCRSYSFNADADGSYTGDGWCNLLQKPKDPGDVCDEFHCRSAESKPVVESTAPTGEAK